MRIIWQNDRFEIEGKDTYDHRETLKAHGVKWDGEKKTWYCPGSTQRLSGLRSLGPTISPDAKAKFEEFEAAKQQTIDASRATDFAGELPCPKGLSYLPYQKAGIVFALKVFGDLK